MPSIVIYENATYLKFEPDEFLSFRAMVHGFCDTPIMLLKSIMRITLLLEIIPWHRYKLNCFCSKNKGHVSCKRCESAFPMDFLTVLFKHGIIIFFQKSHTIIHVVFVL